jgi:SecD/SecF fusion protein
MTASYSQDIGSDVEMLRIATPFDQAANVVAALKAAHPEAGFDVVGESRVGPTIGKEIRNNAAWAIFWSLTLILVYVAFRFEIGYGVGAVVCTIHDVLLTIGIFVMLGKQFNASMVGAILLIVGYSINDTIIVFDRIREELKLDPTTKLRDIINLSLNVTLSRTESNAWYPLLAAAMMVLGSALQTNGLGSWLWVSTKRLMAVCRATSEGKTPRLSRRLVSLAKKVSTALSQEHEVGVKGKIQRGWRASHCRTLACLWAA